MLAVLLLAICAAAVIASLREHGFLSSPVYAPYRDATLDVEVRVDDLLARMTLAEKIGQMALVEKNSVVHAVDVPLYGLGGVLSGGGGKPVPNTPGAWREMVGTFTLAARSSHLGIPLLYGVDAIHGHTNVPGATVFPHPIGLGAADSEALVEAVARATARELRATGVTWNFAPALDLPSDIRWGRVYEAFSDDPARAARLGAAFVRGSRPADGDGVLTAPKHFIGVGGMRWGTAGYAEYQIDQGVTPADELLLRDAYLPPFQAAIDAGALSIMVGLNSWGDQKLTAHRRLLTEVLKGELGFSGFVVSDWYGVYALSEDHYAATVTAVNAGVDMVMLPFAYPAFVRDMTRAVEQGDIPEARVDDAVRRILRAKFSLGLFEQELPLPLAEVGSDTHRALAREAAARSLVALKDDGALLPLSGEVAHIRVAGSAADNVGMQAGGWTVEWQGIDGNWLPGATSILSGIRDVAGANVRVEYDRDARFPEGARAAVGIAVVGERPYAEGYGDNPSPELTAEDLATIARLRTASEQVIVVLVTGRPLLIADALPDWDALVVAWLPGSEGAGVADGLFGKVPISGSLPVPWPRSVEQLPITPAGETADGTVPLFPRGYRIDS